MALSSCRLFELSIVLLTLSALVSSRAVNISNTWMLPEEGFPVFYRYFRDRISWYEADAVCQFHHANLVTADTTSQYDAIRAYLKELDITENIWIGLSKTAENSKFSWTDFRPLSGDGHWQQPIPSGNEAMCVTMDPASDFLWKPMSCGGPEVASFICELPVPSWALGPKGCLLTELPSLTVLYIPEQLALELTSDCGLDGTKRIVCKGNADREEILKQLTCAIPSEDFESTPLPITASSPNQDESSSEEVTSNSKTTKPWIWTSNTIDVDYGLPTRHRRETEDTLSPSSTKSTTDLSVQQSAKKSSEYEVTSTSSEDDVTLDLSVKLTSSTATTMHHEEEREMTGSISVTAESKTDTSVSIEDTGEYPSAINQGQLFSIIENGTMFDIIELNETSDDSKTGKTTSSVVHKSTSSVENISTTSNTSENLYTTVVYHKEPPSEEEATSVTNKSPKKQFEVAAEETTSAPNTNTSSKKDLSKSKEVTKKTINPTKKSSIIDKMKIDRSSADNEFEMTNKGDKTLSKEIEMFPILTDPLVKLNRTFRKELPSMMDDMESLDGGSSYGTPTILNFTKNNRMDVDDHDDDDDDEGHHQHVENTLYDNENNKNSSFIVTTKRVRNVTDSSPRLIDPKIDLINSNVTENRNSDSEMIITKEKFLPKSLLGIQVTTPHHRNQHEKSNDSSVMAGVQPEPQAKPRPNRQRQLTRPQRRSFYPYFFSRVLG